LKSLKLHLVVMVKGLLLGFAEYKGCQSTQKNWEAVKLLDSQGSSKVT
jgi:hypothetical protein